MTETLAAPRFQIADIFARYSTDYCQAYRPSRQQSKAMHAIRICRTPAMGGHMQKCDHCGYERPFLHSCRNRHCPRCQYLARERWLAARKKDLLPIVYYHVVFTIPDEQLGPVALVNQRVMYDLLFRSASETLLQLGRDAKHLGAEIGITAVLHTWAQNLMAHPHLHCIVTGGGLAQDGKRWVSPKKSSGQKNFFIHVHILSDLFKKKFLAYFKEAYQLGKLEFAGRIAHLQSPQRFKTLLDELYGKTWNTYCKESFGGPEQVIDYLGRYTHRVAISNHRIVDVKDGQVFFSYIDRKKNEKKIICLDAVEFIRRFLLHILPHGFYKIRYYGILSSRNHKSKLARCRQLLDAVEEHKDISSMEWLELLFELTGYDLRICPLCKIGHMVQKSSSLLTGPGPP